MASAPLSSARPSMAMSAAATGTSVSCERWYNTVVDMWFRQFSQGGDPALTGFEHVVVGEQEGPKAQGYHFWYKYWLDDGFARQVDPEGAQFPGLGDDRIVYLGSKQKQGQQQFPESVTISYKWHAADYDRQEVRPLTKKIGGFFVGCSVEGLLALGTVRAHLGARAPKEAVINGARYQLKVFRSANDRHVRTFYPVFLGPDGGGGNGNGNGEGNGDGNVVAGTLRIVAALVNPEGHDPGHETVTLINTGAAAQTLDGWRLTDKNGNSDALGGSLGPGDALRVTLDGNGAQLSNKGGKLSLVDPGGRSVHTVTYSKGQARTDGQTILF